MYLPFTDAPKFSVIVKITVTGLLNIVHTATRLLDIVHSVFAMCFVIFVGVCLFVCLKQTGSIKRDLL